MADATIESLGKTLDSINDKIRDFEKSGKAAEQAATDVASLKADLAQQKLEIQKVFEIAKRVPQMTPGEKDQNRAVGEGVIKAFRRQVMKQQSEGTDADGGYLVQDEFATAIRSTQNRYGVVDRIWAGRIIPMASDVLKVPVRAYGDTTGNQPEMQDISENAQISADTGKVAQITLTAVKKGVLVHVSRELIADSFVDFVGAYLREQIAHEAAKKRDDIVFNTASTGLLTSTNIQSVTMDPGEVEFTAVTIEKLRAMQDAVTDDAFETGGYYMHRTIKNIIANIRANADAKGAFLWGNANEGRPSQIDGYAIDHVGKMPARSATAAGTKFVLFGDLPSAMLVGERNTAELALSSDFRFDYDQVSVRYLFRMAHGTDANLGRAACTLKTAAA